MKRIYQWLCILVFTTILAACHTAKRSSKTVKAKEEQSNELPKPAEAEKEMHYGIDVNKRVPTQSLDAKPNTDNPNGARPK